MDPSRLQEINRAFEKAIQAAARVEKAEALAKVNIEKAEVQAKARVEKARAQAKQAHEHWRLLLSQSHVDLLAMATATGVTLSATPVMPELAKTDKRSRKLEIDSCEIDEIDEETRSRAKGRAEQLCLAKGFVKLNGDEYENRDKGNRSAAIRPVSRSGAV